jgi:rhodanese-related sulfurtransferase
MFFAQSVQFKKKERNKTMSQKKQIPISKNVITAQQLKEKIAHLPDILVINVLDHETYLDCHITGSVNIELDHLLEHMAGLDKDKEIVLYCANASCPKSGQAYELLHDLGFTHLYAYSNGMKDWFAKGFDCTGMCAMGYLKE